MVKKGQEASKNMCTCNKHLGPGLTHPGPEDGDNPGTTATWPPKVNGYTLMTWPLTVPQTGSQGSPDPRQVGRPPR